MTPSGRGAVSAAEIPEDVLAPALEILGWLGDLRAVGDFLLAGQVLAQLVYATATGGGPGEFLSELLAAHLEAPASAGGGEGP